MVDGRSTRSGGHLLRLLWGVTKKSTRLIVVEAATRGLSTAQHIPFFFQGGFIHHTHSFSTASYAYTPTTLHLGTVSIQYF